MSRAGSRDEDESLLAGVLEAIGHRGEGYRKVSSRPRARLGERRRALGLGPAEYVRLVAADPGERLEAERLVAVTLSRFFRDRALWERLDQDVLPQLARSRPEGRVWSAATASGEEAYSVALLVAKRRDTEGGACPVHILGTDFHEGCLARARRGAYPRSSVREVPKELLERDFRREGGDGGELVLDESVRRLVTLAVHDLARDPWPRGLGLLLLRNVVFTYWAETRQREAVEAAAESLRNHGWLAIGARERLPAGSETLFREVDPGLPLYRRRS